MTGKEAELILLENKANAMYIPSDVAGEPGMLVLRETADRSQIIEELMHLEQHRMEGFRELTSSQVIDMEIEAHATLLDYAKKNNWKQEEIDLLEQNKASWEQDRKLYDSDEKFRLKYDKQKPVFMQKPPLETDWRKLSESIEGRLDMKKLNSDPNKA